MAVWISEILQRIDLYQKEPLIWNPKQHNKNKVSNIQLNCRDCDNLHINNHANPKERVAKYVITAVGWAFWNCPIPSAVLWVI